MYFDTTTAVKWAIFLACTWAHGIFATLLLSTTDDITIDMSQMKAPLSEVLLKAYFCAKPDVI